MNMSDDDESRPRKWIKGVKQKAYKCETIKKSILQNLPYVNYKGNLRQPKSYGYDCSCRARCLPVLLSEELCDEIYKKFTSFLTKNEQDAYLQSMMSLVPVARRRARKNSGIQRSTSMLYRVSHSAGEVKVCKKAFLSLHGVTSERLRRLKKLLALGKAPCDLRGKNISHVTDIETRRSVEEHISSFPFKISRYSSREYKYLDSKLNIMEMHRMYKIANPNTKVKYSYYKMIFNSCFNLSFGRPQVDTCCDCEVFDAKLKSSTLNEIAKRVTLAEQTVHKTRAKKFFEKMRSMKEICESDSEVCAIAIDYMQNIQLPNIPVQDIFYYRQLSLSLFNVHSIGSGKSRLYLYHQGIARKSPDEVASFIYDYINEVVPPQVKHFHIFADACGGQNRNNTLVRLCLALVATKRFQTVTQYFPIRGHSFSPCDRDFGVIKRSLKKVDRIYLPKQCAEIILKSSNKTNFELKMVKNDDILAFTKWWTNHYKKKVISEESKSVKSGKIPKDKKQPFNVSEFRQFDYASEFVGAVKAHPFIDSPVFHTFRLAKDASVPVLPIEKAYPLGKIPINIKKMGDLKKIEKYLPPEEDIKTFYQEIYMWPISQSDDEDEVIDL